MYTNWEYVSLRWKNKQTNSNEKIKTKGWWGVGASKGKNKTGCFLYFLKEAKNTRCCRWFVGVSLCWFARKRFCCPNESLENRKIPTVSVWWKRLEVCMLFRKRFACWEALEDFCEHLACQEAEGLCRCRCDWSMIRINSGQQMRTLCLSGSKWLVLLSMPLFRNWFCFSGSRQCCWLERRATTMLFITLEVANSKAKSDGFQMRC